MKFRKGDAKALTSLIVGIIVAVGLIFIAVKLILFFMDPKVRNIGKLEMQFLGHLHITLPKTFHPCVVMRHKKS